jgi:hypothetical protein
MAKALKKRALAEYSQTITVEAGEGPSTIVPPIKRLRLRKPVGNNNGVLDGGIPPVLEQEIGNLDPSRSSSDNFKALSRIVSYFPSTNVNTKYINM